MNKIPNNHADRLAVTTTALNNLNNAICIAKWKQVTVHLQTGHTHSCHHPSTHVIPISEITKTPSALHNTEFKKLQREKMLNGIRPTECNYCWKVEDSGNISDRYYKSSEKWALPHLQDIINAPWNDDVVPSYVEVSFSSVCNFKCSYCNPSVSSKWMEEINQYGPYPTTTNFNNLEWIKQDNKMPIPEKDNNPYVTAFWNWWPTIYNELQHFRITGGEPLLSKHTFLVLDYIIENPNTNLTLEINSNLNVPDILYNKFLNKLQYIQINNLVKDIVVFTSVESVGAQAEYIRFGMNYSQWLSNLDKLLDTVPRIKTTIMSTYNLLSILRFKELLMDVLHLRKKYNTNAIANSRAAVLIDIPYLTYPEHQSAMLATSELLPLIAEQISFMETNIEPTLGCYIPYNGFHLHEINKLKRIFDLVNNEINTPSISSTIHKRDFIKFVDEHDIRRGTNFKETFPEFASIYNKWKQL